MGGESSVIRAIISEVAREAESPLLKDLRIGETRDLSSYSRAYGKRARLLLQQIQAFVQETVAGFAATFYEELARREPTATVLARFTPDELAILQEKQTQHLVRLLSPTLTVREHFERSKWIGRAHEMVGVDLPAVLEGYHLYQRKIQVMLPKCGLDARRQDAVGRILTQRLMLEMEAQSISHYEIDVETTQLISDLEKRIQNASTLADVLNGATLALAGLDAVLTCLISRPDPRGNLLIEAAAGSAGRKYVDAMQGGLIPVVRIDAQTAAGLGPTGQAWRTAQIVLADSWSHDPSLGPWREVGLSLGFRSSASVPLLDESGRPFAMLVLYSRWPGFFRTGPRQSLLSFAQHALSQSILRFERGAAVPIRVRRKHQKLLQAGAVQMLYQPIIGLHDGALGYVEALARLCAADGDLLSPPTFLPSLGSSDLLELFRLGLNQVCRDIHSWRGKELAPIVALNMPAEALTDPAYRDTLFDVLSREEVSPKRIQLEILESRDPIDSVRRDTYIAEFRAAGIRIAQDDLGSGHSSLLRMDRIPFDSVKIDQGLVRSAMDDPKRALEFVFHLTRLSRGFGIPVTVEGLENDALIEAVAILGADYGQGYGIAKPMPPAELPKWCEQFTYDFDPQKPRTPLGALAGYLLWDQQRDVLNQWPDLLESFAQFPCLVDRYIECHGLRESALDALLKKNRALASFGTTNADYQRTKSELIALLTRG